MELGTGGILVLDAMPMVADVIMGVAPRPETFEAHPERVWWHWAVKTQAGRLALATIGCTVPIDRPWFGTTQGWRVQPWVDAEETDTLGQFGHVVTRLREALGDPNAGTFYAEICRLNPITCQYVRSNRTMIAVSVDGTRAAIAR